MNVAVSFVLKLLAGLAVLWFAMAAFIFVAQGRLIYVPRAGGRAIIATPDDLGLLWDDVRIRAEDGIELHGWFVTAPEPTADTVIFFHGNAGNISHRLETLRILADLGVNTFIISYRGFGQSEGRPSEAGLNRDADAAWRYLTETRGIPPGNIVLFGRSLGGSVAAALAARTSPAADSSARRGPAGLIVESTFTSIPDLAARHYPIFPVRLLARHRHPTLQYVRETGAPVLIAHSRTDEVAPWSHGQALLAAASRRGSFLELQGGHNDGFMLTGAAYVEGLRAFLRRVLP